MYKELELWQFIGQRLKLGQTAELLVVADSTGSSPGRPGYKMAVAADGTLCGSIGGGIMEIRLVEHAKKRHKTSPANAVSELIEQVHRRDAPNASGMICSGKQTILHRSLTPDDTRLVDKIIAAIGNCQPLFITITPDQIDVRPIDSKIQQTGFHFELIGEADFLYRERLGKKNDLYIVGGGHCSLALSELASKLDFQIHIFDDRPDLNTIEKNRFADEISIIDGYEQIGGLIAPGQNAYVVVMTLGYASDEIVIRQLIEMDIKYLGVLGSKAKMATLLRQLGDEGCPTDRLNSIHTPIGLPIKSHTPEEIAVSIAAEMISIMNA